MTLSPARPDGDGAMVEAHGYSGKPLAAKLGVKTGTRLVAVGAPPHYEALLGELPTGAVLARAALDAAFTDADIVHLFVAGRAELEAAAQSIGTVREGAALWVSWPKKTSHLFRNLTEDGLREILLPLGIVDVKVAAVDADWSGLKFLWRRKT